MNRNLLLLWIAFAVLALSSCRDDDPGDCGPNNSYNSISEVYDDFFYQTGSYWVFQDAISGDLDSIWVASTALDTTTWVAVGGPGPCNKTTVYDPHYNMEMQSSRLGSLQDWTLMSTGINWWDFAAARVNFSGITGDGAKLYFGARDNEGRSITNSSSPLTTYLRQENSLLLPAGLFVDIAVFQIDEFEYPFLSQETAFEMYWSAEGLVRWDHFDDRGNVLEQWQLLRWNVVR